MTAGRLSSEVGKRSSAFDFRALWGCLFEDKATDLWSAWPGGKRRVLDDVFEKLESFVSRRRKRLIPVRKGWNAR